MKYSQGCLTAFLWSLGGVMGGGVVAIILWPLISPHLRTSPNYGDDTGEGFAMIGFAMMVGLVTGVCAAAIAATKKK